MTMAVVALPPVVKVSFLLLDVAVTRLSVSCIAVKTALPPLSLKDGCRQADSLAAHDHGGCCFAACCQEKCMNVANVSNNSHEGCTT